FFSVGVIMSSFVAQCARRGETRTRPNYFLFTPVRVSSIRTNGDASRLGTGTSCGTGQTKCATLGARAVARNITSAPNSGPSCRGTSVGWHCLCWRISDRLIDGSRPSPGRMIHTAAIGLQALPAGDAEVGANGSRHPLSLDAAQTEVSKAIVDRFGLLG